MSYPTITPRTPGFAQVGPPGKVERASQRGNGDRAQGGELVLHNRVRPRHLADPDGAEELLRTAERSLEPAGRLGLALERFVAAVTVPAFTVPAPPPDGQTADPPVPQ